MLEAVEKAAMPSAAEPEKAKARLWMGPSIVELGTQPFDEDTKTVLEGHEVAQAVDAPNDQDEGAQAAHDTAPADVQTFVAVLRVNVSDGDPK